jgi:hypothetical protein
MSRKMIEVSPEKFDKRVMNKLKRIAGWYGVAQREAVWEAIRQFVEKYDLDELHKMPNPFEGETDEPPD